MTFCLAVILLAGTDSASLAERTRGFVWVLILDVAEDGVNFLDTLLGCVHFAPFAGFVVADACQVVGVAAKKVRKLVGIPFACRWGCPLRVGWLGMSSLSFCGEMLSMAEVGLLVSCIWC